MRSRVDRSCCLGWIAFLFVLVPGQSVLAAKFPPAIEKRRYKVPVEEAIAELRRQSLPKTTPVVIKFKLNTRLNIDRRNRVIRTFEIPRHGTCYAHGERLDIREFAEKQAIELQLLRRGNSFLQYFVYECDLRRLWPDSLEKDRRADELTFSYVWLPVLVNLYPDEYMRWADDYEYEARARFEGVTYRVLHASPDYSLARDHRDIQSSAEYWGLRPQVRYYLNPQTHRVEAIERLVYRWDRLKPDEPSFLLRRLVSRVLNWENHGGVMVPTSILGQEINPRAKVPYKEIELDLRKVRVGDRPPKDAFTGVWPGGHHLIDAELRNLDYYREFIRSDDGEIAEWLMAAQTAFAIGDRHYAERILEKIEKRVGDVPEPGELMGICRTYHASGDAALVSKGGRRLQAALDRLHSIKTGSLTREALIGRDNQLVRLHLAVGEHLSLPSGVDDRGRTWHDRRAAATYLENALEDVRHPEALQCLTAKCAVEYARAGLWEKGLSILRQHGARSKSTSRGAVFLKGAEQRVGYWKKRSDWWNAIKEEMRRKSRERRAKRQENKSGRQG